MSTSSIANLKKWSRVTYFYLPYKMSLQIHWVLVKYTGQLAFNFNLKCRLIFIMITSTKFSKWMHLWNECWHCKVLWYGNAVKGCFFWGGGYSFNQKYLVFVVLWKDCKISSWIDRMHRWCVGLLQSTYCIVFFLRL